MIEITEAFEAAADALYAGIVLPEGADAAYLDFASPVCVEHQRFLPCRTCMYGVPASVPYSVDPREVEKVSRYQNSPDEK